MSNVKKEVKSIVASAKQIGQTYRDTGIAVGNAYKKAGLKTAELFKGLYNGEDDESQFSDKP